MNEQRQLQALREQQWKIQDQMDRIRDSERRKLYLTGLEWENTNAIRVLSDGDAATLEIASLSFSYGYEYLWCPIHGFGDSNREVCEEADCENRECAFVVKNNGKILFQIPQHDLHPELGENCDPSKALLYGMGLYFAGFFSMLSNGLTELKQVLEKKNA